MLVHFFQASKRCKSTWLFICCFSCRVSMSCKSRQEGPLWLLKYSHPFAGKIKIDWDLLHHILVVACLNPVTHDLRWRGPYGVGVGNNILPYKKINHQVLQSDFFWTYKWPFEGLSDLHLGNPKVTLNPIGRYTWNALEDQPSCDVWPWLVSPRIGLFPFQMAFPWLEGDPNHWVPLTIPGMIIQVPAR